MVLRTTPTSTYRYRYRSAADCNAVDTRVGVACNAVGYAVGDAVGDAVGYAVGDAVGKNPRNRGYDYPHSVAGHLVLLFEDLGTGYCDTLGHPEHTDQ